MVLTLNSNFYFIFFRRKNIILQFNAFLLGGLYLFVKILERKNAVLLFSSFVCKVFKPFPDVLFTNGHQSFLNPAQGIPLVSALLPFCLQETHPINKCSLCYRLRHILCLDFAYTYDLLFNRREFCYRQSAIASRLIQNKIIIVLSNKSLLYF